MAISVPRLDVYYIDITDDPPKKNDNPSSKTNSVIGKNTSTTLVEKFVPRVTTITYSLLPVNLLFSDIDIAINIVKSLKRLIEEERFYIIRTSKELAQFENACGNNWLTGKKALKRKQYYIRHPKKSANNLLIESQCFYEYIEHEEKDELIDYIFSHCSAKSIQIDRTVVVEADGNTKVSVKAAKVSASANGTINNGNFYSYNNPNGSIRTTPREEYIWLDKSIMRSIANLGENASLTQTYESDYRFGLTAKEASFLGLDLNWHKKFQYTIHIEC